jgi:hypothetical protein
MLFGRYGHYRFCSIDCYGHYRFISIDWFHLLHTHTRVPFTERRRMIGIVTRNTLTCRACSKKHLIHVSLMSKNWNVIKKGTVNGTCDRAWSSAESLKRKFMSSRTVLGSLKASRIPAAVDSVPTGRLCSRKSAEFQSTVFGMMICAAWAANLTPLYSGAEAPVDSDIRKSTKEALSSVTALHASVLSMDVVGKSSRELRQQLDLCNARIAEARKERDELFDLKKQVKESLATLERLMYKPGLSDKEKAEIQSKLEELGHLRSKFEEREDQLLKLLVYSLYGEREILRKLLKLPKY